MVLCAMLTRRQMIFGSGAVTAYSAISLAAACSVVISRWRDPREYQKMARDALSNSTVVIDAEVVRPFIEGKQNALVRAERVFKRPNLIEFEVGERDTCSILLTRMGERRRMLLIGGPDVYDLQYDGSNARYEDRILKSDRRKVWPYRAGTQVEQPPAR